MKVAKYNRFYVNLVETVTNLDVVKVKRTIGDSVNNNRTLTVNQVIRFLNKSKTFNNKLLGGNLESTYEVLKDFIAFRRNFSNRRTDAIDINEFLKTYEIDVLLLSNRSLRNSISKNIVY